MDKKTARKHGKLKKLRSEVAPSHTWRTREDPFAEIWPEVYEQLELNSGLEAKTLFEWLQRKYPGRFHDGQSRTFQRGMKRWRATEGPQKEVFFSQVHHPGRLSATDFTHMTNLDVTIQGQAFDHLVYHFVLTYSNWESVSHRASHPGQQRRRFRTLSAPQRSAAAPIHRTGGIHRV